MAKFVVGLRGGIGTGKTSVSDLFAARSITIADADISARRVVEPGRPAYRAIVEHFGRDILLPDETLNRARLREIVFKDPDSRRFLEQQTQKPIVDDLLTSIADAESAYVILVLSTGLGKWPLMQRLLVIDASRETQIQRVMARDNNSRQQVEAIIDAQPSREDRLRDADDLIVNEGDLARLEVEVGKLHTLYLDLALQEG
jgi:dephospho-CoA kinase